MQSRRRRPCSLSSNEEDAKTNPPASRNVPPKRAEKAPGARWRAIRLPLGLGVLLVAATLLVYWQTAEFDFVWRWTIQITSAAIFMSKRVSRCRTWSGAFRNSITAIGFRSHGFR